MRSDLLWTEGTVDWQPAGSMTAIFEGLPPDLKPASKIYTPPPIPRTVKSERKNIKKSKASVLIGVFIGLIVIWRSAIFISDRSHERESKRIDVEWSASLEKIQEQDHQRGFNTGHEAGFLQGIADARQHSTLPMNHSSAKLNATAVNNLLRAKGEATMSEAMKKGFEDGLVAGYAEGVRKVFVDGR